MRSSRHIGSRRVGLRILSMPRYAFVYSGDGASQRSILSTIESLKATLDGVQVRQLNGVDLLEGGWQEHAAILVFPGGADLPYCKFLNGAGNNMIAEYVRHGGSYLGLCAGGYYACSRIEFEKGRQLEVKGERELSFFPGLGRGAVEPGFEYNTEAGSSAIPIRFQDIEKGREWVECRDYCNGGPSFLVDESQSQAIDILAEYVRDPTGNCQEEIGAAAVRCQVDKGVAVLCGTHPELSPWWLDANCNPTYMRRVHPDLPEVELSVLVQRASCVKAALNEDQYKRGQFWKSLLSAAGLDNHVRKSSSPSECIHPIAKGILTRSPRGKVDLGGLMPSETAPFTRAVA